jgi:hypothetical protein
MVAEVALATPQRQLPRPMVLVAIPVVFAVLGYLIRLLAYPVAARAPDEVPYPDGLCLWDCQWYVNLAARGYDPYPVPDHIDAGNWAFFPLFPMMVGAAHAATGLPVMAIATAISLVIAGLAVWVAWPLLERNLRAYTLYAAFLLCGPFSIYFTTFFTEVLFVLLTNCVFVALRQSKYLMTGLAAALLSATRIVGVFAVFAIAVQYIEDFIRRGGTWRSLVSEIWQRPGIVLAILIAPFGAFLYMAFLYGYIGDALAFSHVQRAWGRVTGNPFGYLWQAVTDFKPGFGPSTNQWLAIAALGGLALTGLLAWRRRYAEAVFCIICLVVPLSAGMASMLRFVVALSPIVVLAITLLARQRLLFWFSLAACIASDYVFTLGWLDEHWFALV